MAKTVIFLGAGASKSDGAPLTNALIREYFKIVQQNDNNVYLFPEADELRNYFYSFFKTEVDFNDLDKVQFPTFEEALGMLDLATIRGEDFIDYTHASIAANDSRIAKVKLYLILLCARVLHEKLVSSGNWHETLVENLAKNGNLSNIAFISTNYDILIDNALLSKSDAFKVGQQIDYGVEFYNFESLTNFARPIPSATKLYKIHGSLNWLKCSVCNTLLYTPMEKGVSSRLLGIANLNGGSGHICSVCESLFSPIIVPPTFFKDMGDVFLQTVWNKTEQLLLNANHVIFCGYSLADADLHIKYLLKRAQINRPNKQFRISVLNQYPDKDLKEQSEERARYERFFGKTPLDYETKYTFKDFCNQPSLIIK